MLKQTAVCLFPMRDIVIAPRIPPASRAIHIYLLPPTVPEPPAVLNTLDQSRNCRHGLLLSGLWANAAPLFGDRINISVRVKRTPAAFFIKLVEIFLVFLRWALFFFVTFFFLFPNYRMPIE